MAVKAVLYKLKPSGEQPYMALKDYNIVFEGGLAEKNGVYLGIATGTLTNMQNFATAYKDHFDFKVVTKDEAVAFYTSCLPAVIEYPPQPTRQEMINALSAKIP